MKPRRVMLMIEVETDAPLATLRKIHRSDWNECVMYSLWCGMVQCDANVIKPKPSKKRK